MARYSRLEDRLVVILAQMVRSVMSWEEEHGLPSRAPESEGPNGLTPIPRRIHWSLQEPIDGGQEDGNADPE